MIFLLSREYENKVQIFGAKRDKNYRRMEKHTYAFILHLTIRNLK